MYGETLNGEDLVVDRLEEHTQHITCLELLHEVRLLV